MNWIKCADQLPEPRIDVLVCAISSDLGYYPKGEKYLCIDRLTTLYDNQMTFTCEKIHSAKPLAWMPLPEMYDEK